MDPIRNKYLFVAARLFLSIGLLLGMVATFGAPTNVFVNNKLVPGRDI